MVLKSRKFQFVFFRVVHFLDIVSNSFPLLTSHTCLQGSPYLSYRHACCITYIQYITVFGNSKPDPLSGNGTASLTHLVRVTLQYLRPVQEVNHLTRIGRVNIGEKFCLRVEAAPFPRGHERGQLCQMVHRIKSNAESTFFHRVFVW